MNSSPQLTTVVENKFEAFAQDENSMTCTSTSNTNVIENNDTRDKENPSQDKRVEDISSTKEWSQKHSGKDSGSAKSDGNESTQISKEPVLDEQEVSQRSKIRRNGEKSHNIEDGKNRLDMNKCNEKHRNQKEEEMQIVDLATTSSNWNVKSPEKHGEIHTIDDEQNQDMDNVVISCDSPDTITIIQRNMGSSNSTIVTMRKNHEIVMGDNMAVVVVPTTLHSDEYQVVRVHSDSPNSTLHDILIHKDANSEPEDLVEIKGIDCATILELNEEQIYNDADISPRVMKSVKSARNGMKQVVNNTEQQLTVLLIDQNSTLSFYATSVYAKCDST
ncbi:hypothetical protein KY289_000539 [Solanum tuberosum]|nr:hypothetical protein KY284_000554 [Solanum tuberosum]KAH0729351.1 hypothetical protein KY289_000539 [Solanum tuberosum]